MNPRSTRSSSRGAALALALLAGLAPGAFAAAPAESPAPPAEDAAAAKVRFGEAQALYDTGRFQEALTAFSEAYDLKPLPGFLFNVGQCHRQLGNWERARFFYKRYLDLSPKRPKNAAQVKNLLRQADAKMVEQETRRRQEEKAARLDQERKQAELDRQKKQAELEAAKTQAELDRQKKEAELTQARKLAEIEAESQARRLALERSLKEAPPVAATPVYKRWWLWAGVGAVVAGGAVAYVATAPRPSPTSLGEADLR